MSRLDGNCDDVGCGMKEDLQYLWPKKRIPFAYNNDAMNVE